MSTTMREDTAASGIARSAIKQLQLKEFTPDQTHSLTGYKLPSYAIPYFNPQGQPTGFYRVKFLAPAVNSSGEEIRYWQKPNTLPALYFAPLLQWEPILQNSEVTITITEGEKKAMAACAAGVPTLAVGGVWSWRSKKYDIPFIAELEAITWANRNVDLCFDSDVASNPQVVRALSALGGALVDRGAVVSTRTLPAPPGERYGLDDYLLHHGVDGYHELEPEPFSASAELQRLNAELAVIPGLGVYHFGTAKFIKRDSLVNVEYAHRIIRIPDGERVKEVSAVTRWLKWPYRRTHAGVTYAPGAEETIDNCVNTWRGWGAQPKRGSVRPFLKLINHMFAGNDVVRTWFMQWLAYPIQHPGGKLLSAVLLYGPAGIGKSLIGYIMRGVYGGDNWVLLGEDELHSTFNDWAVGKQFALGDEISGSDKRRDRDRLKNIITREVITVNAKYQPVYQIPDACNFLFTSNHPDAFYLEEDDRRVLAWEITNPPLSDEEYAEINAWKNGPGPAALHYYLRNDVSLRGFNPKGRPPVTNAKEDMIDLSASDLDTFCRMVREDPDAVLRFGDTPVQRDLFTVAEIIQFLPERRRDDTTWIAMSRALRRAGFRKLPVTRTSSGTVRLWPLRNAQEWHAATPTQRAKHYTQGATTPDRTAKVTHISTRRKLVKK